MTITINASTSSGLVVTPDNSGNILLQYNGVAAPVFRAYQNVQQTIPTNTFTKLQFQVKNFDTNSNYDNVTNYRFTPTVAGYYQINSVVSYAGSTVNTSGIFIYKNGAQYGSGNAVPNNVNLGATATASDIVYCNGSTDYVEIYTWQNTGGNLLLQTLAHQNVFSGCLLRGA